MKKLILFLFLGTQAVAAYTPNNPNGQATMSNSSPVVISSDQSTVGVSDASTHSTLTTINSTLGSPFQAGASIGNTTFGATQSGAWSTGRTWSLLNTTDSVNVGNFPGSFSVSNFPASQAVTGTFWQTTQPVSATTLPLPSNAAQETGGSLSTIATNTTGISTSALQTTGNASLATIATNTATALPSLYITGQATQTATVNNILSTTSGAVAIDSTGYSSATVQVVSTGTAGTFIFEGSNDNTNFQTIPVYNQLITTGTPITAAITATVSQLIYVFPVNVRYIRLRIATTITGGSIQAFTKLQQEAFSPAVFQIANNTAGSLQTTATIASGTISTVTNGNLGFPGIVADVASAAITTTTTTAAFTPTYGNGFEVNIPVTVVSGTTPTLDVEIQESDDSGTNWYPVYDFPRITATGSYRSPVMLSTGNRFRYVQTVSGTTPSFTRAINRMQRSGSASLFRQLIDRSIVLTTLSSNTVTLPVIGTHNLQLEINIGAATTPPAVQLQCSDDAGATYYKVGSPLTAVASSTVSSTISTISCQLLQAVVTTAGSAVTPGYVLIRGFE